MGRLCREWGAEGGRLFVCSPERLCVTPHLCLLLGTPHTWAHIVLNLIWLPFYPQHSRVSSICKSVRNRTRAVFTCALACEKRKDRFAKSYNWKTRSRRGVLFWIRASSSNSHHLSFCPESRCHELFGRWLYENVVFIGWAAQAKFLLSVGSKESFGPCFRHRSCVGLRRCTLDELGLEKST